MRSTDADGKPLDIHTLPPPQNPRRSRFLRDNPDFAAGYINYFVINGAVIAPEFGDARPTPMRANCWNGCIRGARWCS